MTGRILLRITSGRLQAVDPIDLGGLGRQTGLLNHTFTRHMLTAYCKQQAVGSRFN